MENSNFKLIIITGAQGSGKSTVANAICEKLLVHQPELGKVGLLETSDMLRMAILVTPSICYVPREALIKEANDQGIAKIIYRLSLNLSPIANDADAYAVLVNGVKDEGEGVVKMLGIPLRNVTCIKVSSDFQGKLDYRKGYEIAGTNTAAIHLQRGKAMPSLDSIVEHIVNG